MAELGLEVVADPVGNLIGTWPSSRHRGAEPLPPVMIGSHLDSVPAGGRFDGVAGLVVGLEALRSLKRRGFEPPRPIQLVDFTNEEGVRFSPGLFGSQAMVGRYEPGQLKEIRDAAGLSLYGQLVEAGYEPDKLAIEGAKRSTRRPGEVAAYFEVHVEQGGVLEAGRLPLGIVTGIAGPAYLAVTVEGRAAHAGATPMGMRRDALVAAAEMVLEVERTGAADASRVVATVGRMTVEPGAPNVIPGRVTFTVDVRSVEAAARSEALGAIQERLLRVAVERHVIADVEQTSSFAPVLLSESMVGLLQRAAAKVGAPSCRLPSGAAHDAMIIAEVAPVGMIFVRSLGGVSHCPEEETSCEDLALAATVLEEAIAETAGR